MFNLTTYQYNKFITERAYVQRLRIRLIGHLRKTNDPDQGNRMIWSYMEEYYPYTERLNYLNHPFDAFKLYPQLVPDWWVVSVSPLQQFFRVVIKCKREQYICKYVAVRPEYPLVVSAITAKMINLTNDIGKIYET